MRKAQENVQTNTRKGTERGGVEIMGGNENDRSRPGKVQDLCKGPMCHEARGRQMLDAQQQLPEALETLANFVRVKGCPVSVFIDNKTDQDILSLETVLFS